MLKRIGKVIVANAGDDTLSCVDLSNNKVNHIIYLKEFNNQDNKSIADSPSIGPWEMVYDGFQFAYCTNAYDNSIFKLDIKRGKIVDMIYVGSFPTCIRYFDDHLYIANSDSNSISIIDEKKFSLVENIPVGEKPTDIEIDEVHRKVYVANSSGYSMNVIDLEGQNNETIKLKNNPVKMILDGEHMYILYNVNNNIINNSNISLMNLKDSRENELIELKGIFTTMLKINSKEIIFIASIDKGYIYRMNIEKRSLLSKTKLMGMPNKMEWDGDDTIFITDISKDVLYLFSIKANNIINQIKVGREPGGILII